MTLTIVWDMSRERLVEEGLLWLLPYSDPMHPLHGMSRWRRWQWRRVERRRRRGA